MLLYVREKAQRSLLSKYKVALRITVLMLIFMFVAVSSSDIRKAYDEGNGS